MPLTCSLKLPVSLFPILSVFFSFLLFFFLSFETLNTIIWLVWSHPMHTLIFQIFILTYIFSTLFFFFLLKEINPIPIFLFVHLNMHSSYTFSKILFSPFSFLKITIAFYLYIQNQHKSKSNYKNQIIIKLVQTFFF